jgi:hypothetical protein
MKHTKTSLAIAAILAVGTQFAGAISTAGTASLRISDGTTTVTILDETGLDSFLGLGKVVYVGSVGLWSLTVNTGITKPSQGSAVKPYMDLNFIAQSNSPTAVPPNLTVEFSDIGFGPMSVVDNFSDKIGGTTQGSVTCTTLLDVNNILFGGVAIAGPQTFGPGAFACSVGSPGQPTSPFALSKKIVISHGAGTQTSSGDTEVTVPDGGTTLALLGGSLLGLGVLRRRFGKA